jgi:hypothetical protein
MKLQVELILSFICLNAAVERGGGLFSKYYYAAQRDKSATYEYGKGYDNWEKLPQLYQVWSVH